MQEIIERIATAAGIDAATAEKAIGIILGFLQKEGPASEVTDLIKSIPGAPELVAEHAGEGGGGSLGGLMGMMGGSGGLMALAGKPHGHRPRHGRDAGRRQGIASGRPRARGRGYGRPDRRLGAGARAVHLTPPAAPFRTARHSTKGGWSGAPQHATSDDPTRRTGAMASDETLRPISDPAFAAGFPAVAEADWIRLVERALKGGSVDRLVSRTYDGISIAPLYARATGRAPLASAHRGAWDMLARIDHPHPGDANAQALTDLENGATGLHLVFRNGEGAHGFGLPCDAEAVDRVLESIVLQTGVPIEIDAGRDAAEVARHVATIVEARGLEPSALQVHFGLDPVGDAARGGDAAIPPSIATLVKDLRGRGFVAPAVTADGRVIHDAGGSEAQELAFVLGSALAMMRHLHDAGLSLDDARGAISFRLTADADQFLTIAKFRALRLLWSQIERACGLSQKPVLIHAETAWRMMTQRDAFVNMLRATTGAFSAGLGGADRLTVMPFTQAIGLPDAFARRLARNVQLVLIEEANLARVVDPAAGAGGYETLTDEIASAAWTLFQESEKAGGMLAFLPDLSSRVAAVRAERCKNVARRKDPLTGATEFPNLNEMPVEVLAPLPRASLRRGPFSGDAPRSILRRPA